MPKFPPLSYGEVIKILTNLGFSPKGNKSGSHQTWVKKEGGIYYAVTVASHGRRKQEFPDGTLQAMIRQSGCSKKKFYEALDHE